MKLPVLFTIIILLLIGVSCQRNKSEIDPEQQLFPVNYYFVNSSPNKLKAVNLTVSTYFPKIDKTNFFYKSFPGINPNDSLRITIDTTAVTKSLAYAGCETQMEVNVLQQINSSLLYVSTWVTKRDTIKSKQNAQLRFVWPNDTLKAVRKEGYYTKW